MSLQILGPYEGSGLNFMNFAGKTIAERFAPLNTWGLLREEQNIWPFAQTHDNRRPMNFGTQDYLGFSRQDVLVDAVKEFIEEHHIIHSSGSPTLTGRSVWTEQLEDKVAGILKQKSCLIYPSGWMACYGAVTGLTNARDTIVMDALSHNCLQMAAKYTTLNFFKFNHNDMALLNELLEKSRQ